MMEYQLLHTFIKHVLQEKKWVDFHAPKGELVSLQPSDFEAEECAEPPCPDVRDLDDEIFDLIQNAYADVPLGDGSFGNIKVRSPSDLPGSYTVMSAFDFDADPEPDYFRGAKSRGERLKLGVVGHDGSPVAIQKYMDETARELLSGAIAEMSGKIAHIMITRYGVPAVTTKEDVEAMLGKSVNWIGRHPDDKYATRYGDAYEGWYSRNIVGTAGGEHTKILLGG